MKPPLEAPTTATGDGPCAGDGDAGGRRRRWRRQAATAAAADGRRSGDPKQTAAASWPRRTAGDFGGCRRRRAARATARRRHGRCRGRRLLAVGRGPVHPPRHAGHAHPDGHHGLGRRRVRRARHVHAGALLATRTPPAGPTRADELRAPSGRLHDGSANNQRRRQQPRRGPARQGRRAKVRRAARRRRGYVVRERPAGRRRRVAPPKAHAGWHVYASLSMPGRPTSRTWPWCGA